MKPSKHIFSLSLVFGLLFSTVGFAKERSLEQQVGSPVPQPIKAPAGGILSVPVEYTTSDNNNQLTGLGLRIHFDSSLVSWLDFESVFPTDLLSQDSSPQSDTADFDGDPSTDSFLGIAWVSFSGQWPNTALPQHLFDVRFQFAQGLAEDVTTGINFSASSTAAGYQFSGSSVTFEVEFSPIIFEDSFETEQAICCLQ